MNYKINVYKLENQEWNTRAFVAVTFADKLKVTDITIKESKNGNLFIAMLGYKSNKLEVNRKSIYKNFCYPVTAEFRKTLFDDIMKTYESNEEEKTFTDGVDKIRLDVKLRALTSNSNVESIGKLVIDDCFVIEGMRVINGEKGLFVSMTTKSKIGDGGKTEYLEVCYPVTKEFRNELYGELL